MKAAPLLRAWLKRLAENGVLFHYRHQILDLKYQTLNIQDLKTEQIFEQDFDAIILACGAVSWSKLGSVGAWQKWLVSEQIEPRPHRLCCVQNYH